MKKTFKKRAFISAIAMLIVSAIVLTSATFAWFSMAKQVEVEAMDFNVTSPDGIQISANTSAWTTTVTRDMLLGTSTQTRFNADASNTNHFPELISPSSSTLNVSNSLPQFFSGSIADDGRANIARVSDAESGYVVFDLFVKVASAQRVYWGTSTIECADNPDVVKSMRLGIVNCGSSQDKAAAMTLLPSSSGNRRVIMYSPNAYSHTADSGIAEGTYNNTKYLYNGTNGMLVSGANNNVVSSTAHTTDEASIASTRLDDRSDASEMYFNAGAGINRIRVYLWMEGNDIDCANDVAGSTLTFNLKLSIA